jgi:hypothetical protein
MWVGGMAGCLQFSKAVIWFKDLATVLNILRPHGQREKGGFCQNDANYRWCFRRMEAEIGKILSTSTANHLTNTQVVANLE